ncbi:hypothetical protein CMI37_36960 [Candidatus Pacearchaeota archaeon]|nr:hypothetical protein [Candidatus Pacearchaeota archaeon]
MVIVGFFSSYQKAMKEYIIYRCSEDFYTGKIISINEIARTKNKTDAMYVVRAFELVEAQYGDQSNSYHYMSFHHSGFSLKRVKRKFRVKAKWLQPFRE